MGSEAAGLEQAPGDVVGQVAEPEGGPAEVLEPAVDRLGRAVGCAGPVEVGEHVGGALLQRLAQGDHLGERLRDAGADRVDQLDHQLASTLAVLLTVGGDHPLVDAPGGLVAYCGGASYWCSCT